MKFCAKKPATTPSRKTLCTIIKLHSLKNTNQMKNIVPLTILFSFLACRNEVKKASNDEQIPKLIANKSENAILSNDIKFINDSILKGKFKLDISKYELENSKKNVFHTL